MEFYWRMLASPAEIPNNIIMLSVIVPTLNVANTLESVLLQIAEHADEIVVADGGSTDQTLNIALDHRARLALGCAGRGWQLARGAKWAFGDWMLFVHADTRLPPNWNVVIDDHINTHPEKAAYFKFGIDDKGIRPRTLEFLAGIRILCLGLPYGDQGLLISRKLYDEVGGFPDWPLFEDVAIVRALGRRRLRQLPAKVATSPEKFVKYGYIGNLLRNISFITRYWFGADLEKLAKAYQK